MGSRQPGDVVIKGEHQPWGNLSSVLPFWAFNGFVGYLGTLEGQGMPTEVSMDENTALGDSQVPPCDSMGLRWLSAESGHSQHLSQPQGSLR